MIGEEGRTCQICSTKGAVRESGIESAKIELANLAVGYMRPTSLPSASDTAKNSAFFEV